MQRTGFDVEIVLGEDYSTDGTREICKAYQEKYPDRIRMLDRGANLGMCRNIFGSLQECRGQYTAVLDGDDYWTDPLKLQKQYDYLERQQDKNMVFHQTLRMNDLNGLIDLFVREVKPEYAFEEIIDKWLMATGSMFFRTTAMDYPEFVFHTHNFDLAIQLLVNRNGNKIGYINELMSVYHINSGSKTNNPVYDLMNTVKRQKQLFGEFDTYTQQRYHEKISEKVAVLECEVRKSKNNRLKSGIIKLVKSVLGKLGLRVVRLRSTSV